MTNPRESLPSTTVLVSNRGFWTVARSLSEAANKMPKGGFSNGAVVECYRVTWPSAGSVDAQRKHDAAPERSKMVNDDGSPVAYVNTLGQLAYPKHATPERLGTYNHRKGVVTQSGRRASAAIDLPGVHCPVTAGIVGGDSPEFTITYPQRCAFAVVAATQRARQKFLGERGANVSAEDDMDTPRARIGTSTSNESRGLKTSLWTVSRRSVIGLKRLGLVEIVQRRLNGTPLYSHAVLTEKGEKLAAQWPEDIAAVEALSTRGGGGA